MDISPSCLCRVLENHRGYFHTEIALIFPSKCLSGKKYPSDVLMPILWGIEIFTGSGKFHSHFNPQFWEKFRGCFSMEISKRFLCSLRQMIHVDKTTCLSSSKFHRGHQESARGLVHLLPIVDIRWILPWVSPDFGDIKWMPPPNFPLLHLHASMIG